jgi:DNA-binding SARP family transcriptional activator
MSLALEVVAHGLTAILATWLGVLVLTRARRAPGAPVFGLLCGLLAIWSAAIIGQRLGTNAEMHPLLNVFEDFGAFLLPAATAHLAISVALEGRRSRLATAVVVVGYAVGLAASLQAAVDPDRPILPSAPHFEPFGIPGEVVGWAFILVRAGLFVAGIGWLIAGLRSSGEDRARRRQLQVTLATVALGVIGGMARILPEGVAGPAWLGVSLVAAAAVLAVYAVLAQRLFAGAEGTARAFRLSVVLGLGVCVYVGVLVAVDRAVAGAIGLDLPIVIGLAVVLTIALFDPVSDAVRGALAGGGAEAVTLSRLLRALGDDVLSVHRGESIAGPAIARLVRTFDLTGAALIGADGTPLVVHGDRETIEQAPSRVAMGFLGAYAVFGPKRSGMPVTPAEMEVLRLAISYVDAAGNLGARHEAQATELAALSREADAVEEREAALAEAFAASDAPRHGLHVYALGPLRAEIDGEPIRQWGGPKAGSRHAEAIFAFLFDRGERGAGKDEIVELVWPDVDLERADMAFHRTMLGLRSVIGSGRGVRSGRGPISFENDRYRLRPGVTAWSDVREFERLLDRGRSTDDSTERVHLLEAARALYRADYLDDCPFYGDSAEVEERRVLLRERYVDLLVDLGIEYAGRGARSAASDALRRARSLTDRALPLIDETLERLGAALETSAAGMWPRPAPPSPSA